jgi:hypothetical protein
MAALYFELHVVIAECRIITVHGEVQTANKTNDNNNKKTRFFTKNHGTCGGQTSLCRNKNIASYIPHRHKSCILHPIFHFSHTVADNDNDNDYNNED